MYTYKEEENLKSFSDLGIDQDIVSALEAKGITHPFPIQEQTIPLAISGQDIIGQSKTGSGKSLGFILPMLQRLGAKPSGVKALIVVPTRELCQQVFDDTRTASCLREVLPCAIYGGKVQAAQVEMLRRGAQIVVGTPGRLLDLVNQRLLDLSQVEELVLDEADRMLDLGFLPDIERLLSKMPTTRHTMLFSATMPGNILSLTRRFMKNPIHICISEAQKTQDNIHHLVYQVHRMDKVEVLCRILQGKKLKKTVIFAKTRRTAARLTETLTEKGFSVVTVHGDLKQEVRERAIKSFDTQKANILVATDVAARGIDFDQVSHVINYSTPEDEAAYLHRVGRTGRAGLSGIAVTLIDWEDIPRWNLLNRSLKLPEAVETYSSSEHLLQEHEIDPPKLAAKAASAKSSSARSGGKKRRRRIVVQNTEG